MAKILSKFGEQQLVMVSYECGLNQSEMGKSFEWIITIIIRSYVSAPLNIILIFGIDLCSLWQALP